MKIAIIGCGYVGTAIATWLKHQGHDITVTTRTTEKAEKLSSQFKSVYILQGNDAEALQLLMENQDVAIICVAADSANDYEKTYLGTAKSFNLATKSSAYLKHIIYTSSTSIYGDHQGRTVTESTEPNPIHSTGKILLDTEQTLMGISSASTRGCLSKVCIFRLGEIYGPGREISKRLRQLGNSFLPGIGQSFTNLIHIDDIVKAIDFALNNKLEGVYNLCNDVHLPRKELYRTLAKKLELPEPQWDASKTSIHSGNKIVSNSKLKDAGFIFSHNTSPA